MDELLTTAEVSGLVRTPPETLRWLRHIGGGPRFFHLGRRVLYARSDVEIWIDEARAAGRQRTAKMLPVDDEDRSRSSGEPAAVSSATSDARTRRRP
jgi:hypothetical protein